MKSTLPYIEDVAANAGIEDKDEFFEFFNAFYSEYGDLLNPSVPFKIQVSPNSFEISEGEQRDIDILIQSGVLYICSSLSGHLGGSRTLSSR